MKTFVRLGYNTILLQGASGLELETKALRLFSSSEVRPAFATVFAANRRELKVLDDFTTYKERFI